VPYEHCTHVFVVWPVALCAVPATQGVQAAADARLAEADHEPAGQGAQAEAPASEYVPAPHCTHSVEPVAPTALEKVPAAQLMHVAAAVAPNVVLYVPALHWTHEVDPVPAKLAA
jgi:hypothetical protein